MKSTLTPARILGAATLPVAMSAAAAQSAARIEAYPVQTVDLTTAQVLAGIVTGPAAVVAGEPRLPPGTNARVAAVVFLHGDAGEVSNQPPWIDELNAIGIAVFTLDSFSGRGFVSKSARMGAIDEATGAPALPRIVDAYRALALLAKHPRTDASRIALMRRVVGRAHDDRRPDDALRPPLRAASERSSMPTQDCRSSPRTRASNAASRQAAATRRTPRCARQCATS